jgi:arylsulfatase
MFANRGIYHDGWYACTTPPEPPWLMGTTRLPDVMDYKWELYNLNEDYSQAHDLAAKMADKVKQLQGTFMQEAAKYEVLPIDNSVLARLLTARPSATSGRDEFSYSGQLAGLPYSDVPSILNRSYTITADVEVPEGGGEGMIVTMGGRFGGYGLYILKGKPVFLYNFVDLERFRWEGNHALTSGKHSIEFDFKYDGPGFGKGGAGVLKVDGKEVASKHVPHTIANIMTVDESFDVGSDLRTPVDDKDYQVPFKFTGTIAKVTFKLGREELTDADRRRMQEMIATAHDDR